jgi:hypothetical protein
MASEIDFALSVGMFFIFIGVLIAYITSYLSSYTGLVATSNLRTAAYNIHNSMFGSKGIPSNWESYNYVPVKIGLITDMYRMPIVISNTNNTQRSNITLNLSITFDNACVNKAWNNTLRIYNNTNHEVKFQLYNQSFCTQQFLNTTDIALNLSMAASSNNTFFIYYSPDKYIESSNYSIEFPAASNWTNFTLKVYPEEKMSAISVTKMIALRNKSYDEVVNTLGTEYKVKIEVSED